MTEAEVTNRQWYRENGGKSKGKGGGKGGGKKGGGKGKGKGMVGAWKDGRCWFYDNNGSCKFGTDCPLQHSNTPPPDDD